MLIAPSPFKPVHAALAALGLTLALGGLGPSLHGGASLLPWGAFGLAIAGGAGLLAWHLAQLAALPRAGLAAAALPAALIPAALFPAIGAGALAPVLLLALLAGPRHKLAVCLAGAGAAAALAGGPVGAACASGAMLAAAWRLLPRSPAANDNPSMERAADFWPLPVYASYAKQLSGDSGSNFGE